MRMGDSSISSALVDNFSLLQFIFFFFLVSLYFPVSLILRDDSVC